MKRNLLMLAVCSAMVFAGCQSGRGADSSSSIVSEEKETADLKIGTQDASSQSVVLENATGKTISAVAMKKSDEEKFGESLMEKDAVWKAGEKAELFYQPAEKAQEADTEQKDEPEDSSKRPEIAMIEQTDVEITFEDGSKQTLYSMPLEDIASDGKLEIEDDILFVSYTAKNGDTVSTFESQKATVEAEKKKAEEEAAKKAEEEAAAKAQAEAEAQAQQQAAQEQPVYEEPVYEEPVYEEPVYQEPVYQEPVYEQPVQQQPSNDVNVGDQSGQGCLNLDDLGL